MDIILPEDGYHSSRRWMSKSERVQYDCLTKNSFAMSKVKHRVREFVPKGQQSLGIHSWFAETVINNEIDNAELAKKIAACTGFIC